MLTQLALRELACAADQACVCAIDWSNSAESKDQPAAGAGGAVPAGPDRSAQILALTAEATDMLSNKRDWNAEYQVLLDKLSLAPRT